MKKVTLTLAAIVLIAGIGSSQSTTKSSSRTDLQFGLKAGLNYSNVYDQQGQQFNADAKFGFVGGGFLSIPLGKFLGFQPEILFSQKGFKATGSYLSNNYEFTRTTNYIDIPLLLQIKPVEFVTILVGPQYSYLIKQTDKFTSSIYSNQQQQDFNNDNIRKNILAITGGVDLNLTNVVVGARTGWDVQTNNGDGTSSTPRYKNVWYQLTLGFKL